MDKYYKDGYLEAISDLHRGHYETWIEFEEGDFKDMAKSILRKSQEIKDKFIEQKFKDAIDILKNNFTHFPHLREFIKQRMDETALIYSSIFNISFNEARDKFGITSFLEYDTSNLHKCPKCKRVI